MNHPLHAVNGLYTDYYELTMAQALFLEGRHEETACFDYFFRNYPFGGNYVVFAGLQTLADALRHFVFDDESCKALHELGFDPGFISWLHRNPPRLTIEAPPEGTLVFAHTPVVQVSGSFAHGLLAETLLLNILNFESLIATKASRMADALLPGQLLLDFGLRRSQGFAGFHASRAAYIGGCASSSNVWSAVQYGHPTGGTHAHAWVQAFDKEDDAFRTFARHFPQKAVFLVDTNDSIREGIPKAITVAKEMEAAGHKLFGIRLDSGDFSILIPKARKLLNDAGLPYVKIVVSDNLDEHRIRELNRLPVTADVFGVGTKLLAADGSPALNGVFKLSELNGKAVMKHSDNPEKITLPGQKQLWRVLDEDRITGDYISLSREGRPKGEERKLRAIRTEKFVSGDPFSGAKLSQIRERLRKEKARLSGFIGAEALGNIYPVEISRDLQDLQAICLK
ncbi:MAG: nicotinate phosphoribosyltransferase [Candidatus Cyclonatronum sp.]|uniref:nicotinate phosphoribosyltransferase n=1 Tax=Cyclonatronum sp. TaxID=3024185 RepID=UPI0025C379C0|nr:nicotinate phosphoribosyltransferase [Cyclonatronum sp.]MCH8486461.1 nicotinate phosphoribosyltransferase [Cyclonatronum sp.]